MHPNGVASAAWVFAAAPSKVPFYIAGGLLAGWAVVLAATGLTQPEFPGSPPRERLVMLTSVLLVAATITAAVATAGGPEKPTHAAAGPSAPAAPSGTAAPSSTLQLAANPTGVLAYDSKRASVKAGTVAVHFTNRSPLPHNVTIAKGTKTIGATKTITGATAAVTVKLAPGSYVYYCSVDAHRQSGMQGTLTVR
jgi:plastocyanin